MKIAVLTVVFVLAGCATLDPVVISKGHGLATVSVQPPATIQAVCQHPKALACVPSRPDGVTIFFRLPPSEWGIDQQELHVIAEVVAHELCHAVHQVRRDGSPDPCHDEDGGRLR